MKIEEVLAISCAQTKKNYTKTDLAKALGISRQYVYKLKKLSREQLKLIEQCWNVTLTTSTIRTDIAMIKVGYCVNYWSIDGVVPDQIFDPEISELVLDMQFIVKKLKCLPENLRIISMPGEEMNGGHYPLKNGDLLLIDISKTDISDSGVYFVTTHDNSRVYVRRLLEVMDDISLPLGTKAVKSSVDNPIYQSVNKLITEDRAIGMDLRVIGRVIKNMSLKK